MRKLLMSLACMLFMTGLVIAAEVTLVKFDGDKKEVTVKEGDAEKTYKITDKTKVSFIDKDGNAKDGTLEAATKVLGSKNAPGKMKFEITTDKGDITEMKLKARKGK